MTKNSKTIGTILTAMTAVATLTACSNDDEPKAGAGAQLPITLTASIAPEEATATRSYNATNLLNGDTCYVWADMINGSTGEQSEYFKAWTLIANGSGGLSPQVSGDVKLFPATNVLNFYALTGNFGRDANEEPMVTPGELALPTTGITHTVLADQSTSQNYYKSDLLYAVRKHQEPVSEAVVLPLQHLLSRIEVVIVAGNGMTTTDLSEAVVELMSVKQEVLFTPDTTKDASIRANLANMLVTPNPVKTGNVRMATNVVGQVSDATASAYADAIIVPQTIAGSAALIHVSYLGRDTYYKVPSGGMTFESGKQYRFRLIADRIGTPYTVTPVVSDWTAVEQDELFVE